MIAFALAFGIYLSALIGIGLYAYSRAQSSSAFLLGNRGINFWVTALSTHASDMSSWLFFGLPAAIYAYGTGECWAPVGLVLGMWATWQFVAPRLRVATEKSKSMTLTHFLSHAAHAKGHTLIVLSSLLLVFFFIFYLAAGLKSIGTVFELTFGVNYLVGVCIGAIVVMLYTMLGGYVAVALTDAIQGGFLLIMLLLVPIVTWYNLPAEKLATIGTQFSFTPHFSASGIFSALTTALGWGLGYCGLPHVLTKFMSIDSVKNMKKAQYVGVTWQILALGAATSIGLLARAYFAVPPASGEQLFMRIVTEQFTPLLAGFVFCAVLAATISTLDAQLIVCATIITRDLYQPRNGTAQVRLTRISIALLTGLAVMIAASNTQTLYEIVRYAWSGLGATLGPLVLCSLFARRMLTPHGAIVGMLAGGITAGLWPLSGLALADAPLVPGFFVGLFLIWLCGKATR